MADDVQVIPADDQAPKRTRERTIFAVPQRTLAGFAEFIRERDVASFAIGIIFGGAAQKLVQALMDDLISPLVGIFIGHAQTLSEFSVGRFKIGDFLSVTLNFLLLTFVVYFIFRVLRLEKLNKPK